MSSEVRDWLFMSSIWSPIWISVMYIVSICYLSFVFMKDRDDLTELSDFLRFTFVTILAVVNWGLLIFFIYMQYQLSYDIFCEPPSKSYSNVQSSSSFFSRIWRGLSWSSEDGELRMSNMELRVARGLWVYLLSKITEFSDHFVLIFKNDDLAIQDVFHHIAMVFITWMGVINAPGGSTIVWATFNCAFLSVAFTYQALKKYYMDSSDKTSKDFWMGMKPAIRWLKYAQFILTGLHSFTVIISSCGYPRHYALALFVFVIFLLMAPSMGNYGDGGNPGGGERGRSNTNVSNLHSGSDSGSDPGDSNVNNRMRRMNIYGDNHRSSSSRANIQVERIGFYIRRQQIPTRDFPINRNSISGNDYGREWVRSRPYP